MKSPPNPNPKHRSNRDTAISSEKNEETAQGRARHSMVTIPELREHLEGLRGISTTASKIFALLAGQITSVSYTIPIQRGQEMIKNLKDRAGAHRDGLKTAFDPLREQIKEMKAGFWEKHGARLEAMAQKYIEQKIRERVPLEISKRLKRYVEYIETSEAKKKKLREVVEISDARSRNSLLRTEHPEETITWIGNLPDWAAPAIKFGDLINAEESSVMDLAGSLGLSPAPEDDRIKILNSIMRYLGIAYKGLPSWTGMYLVPTKATL